jgi:methionyl-tRNA formyltransferase
MTTGKKLKIGLFALTGQGNSVLRQLINMGQSPSMLITREEQSEFPHYTEKNISEEAIEKGIPIFLGDAGEAIAKQANLDLILVASYHRILSRDVYRSARLSLNIHPSLLPLYRGPNPYFWTLRNKEKETGVTVHEITDLVNGGAIYWQQRYSIPDTETQGTLRENLASLSGAATVAIVEAVLAGTLKRVPQEEKKSTTQKHPTARDFQIDMAADEASIMGLMRARFPFPGVNFGFLRLTDFLGMKSSAKRSRPGTLLEADENTCLVQLPEGEALFSWTIWGKAVAAERTP